MFQIHITFAKVIRHFASILQIRLYTMAFHFIFIILSAHILIVINNLEQNDKCGGCVPKCNTMDFIVMILSFINNTR